MTRKALLLTIGAALLPSVTPIIPVATTEVVDSYAAAPVKPPTDFTLHVTVDGVQLAWTASLTTGDLDYIVQTAPDLSGLPGSWVITGGTKDMHYTVPLPATAKWVRVYAALNGRMSEPTLPGLATPIESVVITGTASAVATLQDDVTVINGTLVAHASQLTTLDARAVVLETDVSGLVTTTTGLAAADSALDARVAANEGNIVSQSSQMVSLSNRVDVDRLQAARGGTLTFQQASPPAIGGTRYNKLERTEEFTNAYWSKTCSVATSAYPDPLGTLTADRATPTGDDQRVHRTVTGLGAVTGRTFTWSIWLRADTPHDATLQLIAPTAGTTETLHVAVTTAWQRLSVTRVFGAETDTSLRCEVYPRKLGVAGAPNYSVDMFGAQLEEGALGPYQRVGVSTDYDGNGIPVGSTWYDTDDYNRERRWSGASWDPVEDTRIQATADAATALDSRVSVAEGNISAQASDITTLSATVDGKASATAVSALETRVTTTEGGVSSYYASYTLVFDVNGYISGFKSENNGLGSAFFINADVFQVLKPGGGEALSWAGGVLSADKGSKAVKIGAGFGSDATGKKMVFYYGASGSDATRSRSNARLFIAENGDVKLGGVQVNFGSAWSSGAAITYSASAGTPATATISVSAGVFSIGSDSYSYSASSASVTGTGGTSTTFYLYYADPAMLAGARTLYASTDPAVHYTSHGNVVVGALTVAFPASGTASGTGSTPGGGAPGGGGSCPAIDQWVIAPDGPKRAGAVRKGDLLRLCDPRTLEEVWGEVTYSETKHAACVRLQAHSGAGLTCSTSAPIPVGGGYLDAQDCEGALTLGRRTRGVAVERIVTVTRAGVQAVQHITVGDRCFWTGADPEHLLLHHNLKAYP